MKKQTTKNLPVFQQEQERRKKTVRTRNTVQFMACLFAASLVFFGMDALTGSSKKQLNEDQKTAKYISKGLRGTAVILGVLLSLRLSASNRRKKTDEDIQNWLKTAQLSQKPATGIYDPLTKKDMEELTSYLDLSKITSPHKKYDFLQGIVNLSNQKPSFAKLARSVLLQVKINPTINEESNGILASGVMRPHCDHCEIDLALDHISDNQIEIFSHELRHSVQFEKGLMLFNHPEKECAYFSHILSEAEALAYSVIYNMDDTSFNGFFKHLKSAMQQQNKNASLQEVSGLSEDKCAGFIIQALMTNNPAALAKRTAAFGIEHNIRPDIMQQFANGIEYLKSQWRRIYRYDEIYNLYPVSSVVLEQYNAYYKQHTGYNLDLNEVYNIPHLNVKMQNIMPER